MTERILSSFHVCCARYHDVPIREDQQDGRERFWSVDEARKLLGFVLNRF